MKEEKAKASPRSRTRTRGQSSVVLDPPWSEFKRRGLQCKAEGLPENVATEFFVTRTRTHEMYIREQEKTKRLGLILATILILGAAGMLLFAPEGREKLSYWIGAALVIFAAGSVGYQRVWGKTPDISFGADQMRNPVENEDA
jgi:hypothetical protein